MLLVGTHLLMCILGGNVIVKMSKKHVFFCVFVCVLGFFETIQSTKKTIQNRVFGSFFCDPKQSFWIVFFCDLDDFATGCERESLTPQKMIWIIEVWFWMIWITIQNKTLTIQITLFRVKDSRSHPVAKSPKSTIQKIFGTLLDDQSRTH
jgi:hypothetical protein